jgi:mannose-6-phosphate isomerase
LRNLSATSSSKPYRLPATVKEKVWGRTDLSPWYGNQKQKIGEVWFEADLPLLAKFVFTSERLSVQVHPNDAFAQAHEKSRGKTEMWHVLKAEPGAQIALGFRESLSAERLRDSAISGEIEQLLRWIGVKAGDTFFVPAGTVHALGAGLAVCEIQQHSDITYRFYDYGRPRELHLDKAMKVAARGVADVRPREFPVDCEYFHTERIEVTRQTTYPLNDGRFRMLIFLSGRGSIAGEPFQQGEGWLVPGAAPSFTIDASEPASFLQTWVP